MKGRRKGAEKTERPSLSRLRGNVAQLAQLTAEAKSGVERLQLELEDHWADAWDRERVLRDRYYRVMNSVFALLDHFENIAAKGEEGERIAWLYRKTRRILEDEGIEEIAVEGGGPFNAMYHKQILDRAGRSPKGAVLEVTRKGYYRKGKAGRGDEVLRPMEVVVSTGPLSKWAESEDQGEEQQ